MAVLLPGLLRRLAQAASGPLQAFGLRAEATDVYTAEEGLQLLSRSLEGHSEASFRPRVLESLRLDSRRSFLQAGEEAWKMKFAIRCSKNPVSGSDKIFFWWLCFTELDATVLNFLRFLRSS